MKKKLLIILSVIFVFALSFGITAQAADMSGVTADLSKVVYTDNSVVSALVSELHNNVVYKDTNVKFDSATDKFNVTMNLTVPQTSATIKDNVYCAVLFGASTLGSYTSGNAFDYFPGNKTKNNYETDDSSNFIYGNYNSSSGYNVFTFSYDATFLKSFNTSVVLSYEYIFTNASGVCLCSGCGGDNPGVFAFMPSSYTDSSDVVDDSDKLKIAITYFELAPGKTDAMEKITNYYFVDQYDLNESSFLSSTKKSTFDILLLTYAGYVSKEENNCCYVTILYNYPQILLVTQKMFGTSSEYISLSPSCASSLVELDNWGLIVKNYFGDDYYRFSICFGSCVSAFNCREIGTFKEDVLMFGEIKQTVMFLDTGYKTFRIVIDSTPLAFANKLTDKEVDYQFSKDGSEIPVYDNSTNIVDNVVNSVKAVGSSVKNWFSSVNEGFDKVKIVFALILGILLFVLIFNIILWINDLFKHKRKRK